MNTYYPSRIRAARGLTCPAQHSPPVATSLSLKNLPDYNQGAKMYFLNIAPMNKVGF